MPGAGGRPRTASEHRLQNALAAPRVCALLPGSKDPAMVKHGLRCWKDDRDQVPTQPVSARWIMSQPTFALGAADARAGRGIHGDYDLWDISGQWNYERGRA